jgi:ring-1,2-phenylacetyl-CoA epoxidase subunit PaaD
MVRVETSGTEVNVVSMDQNMGAAQSEQELTDRVEAVLYDVFDPEIPHLSIQDLGMVKQVAVNEKRVFIQLTPTFMGCPALSLIRRQVSQAVLKLPDVEDVVVEFNHDEPWTTERITAVGKQKLKEFGIAPPACALHQLRSLTAACPYCGSEHTRLENAFGPTACRALFYCEDCRQPFEGMKPV